METPYNMDLAAFYCEPYLDWGGGGEEGGFRK